MTNPAQQTIWLKDYTPPAYLVESVSLTFALAPRATRVVSKIAFRPNPETADRSFFLHGEQLNLLSAKIDGKEVTPDVTEDGLTCPAPDAPFVWEAEVEISPETNTALEGLYMSNGMYCTQCEAEGFRKITYYPDRPDVMAPFTVRIESDLPVLLSNGNPSASGDGWAEWHDPWPKPAYLFALVAGELVNHPDRFTTKSGKDVELNIWVRPGDEGKCAYGMDALKRSMTWDEEVYGREYDLDIFNIVAVDDFNMGAMENKGLNIFNSSAVLCSPETSTDANFARIEAIIAHEYFHNWTGNRITCRDWFQLCLKEGLTVYRDQQFSRDMRGEAVHRIEEVLALRARQFREDAGPLAHPVRPESFVEINNFYTATVYEKGAEVIGMLKQLVGDEGYAKALDLYFERHDGDASTIEDWLKVFEDATGRDLTQFKRWYSQAGTPQVRVTDDYADGRYTLTLEQETQPTPGQSNKDPLVIPVAVGLLNPNGDEVQPTTVLELTEAKQSFTFEGLSSRPVPSILRGFSAPVTIQKDSDDAERTFLLAHDTDPFNKWEAGRTLAKSVLSRMVLNGETAPTSYLDALRAVARDDTLDPAFRSLALALPGGEDMAQSIFALGHCPDPDAIFRACRSLRDAIAAHLSEPLASLYDQMAIDGPFSPDAKDAGRRSLRQSALSYLTRLDGGERATALYAAADNMTEQLGALASLIANGHGQSEVQSFANQWGHDRLVMDKWFGLQISHAQPEEAVSTAEALTQRDDFDWKNPNRFRSVIGALAMNSAGFHQASGAGYAFVADWLIRMDEANPQTAARMSTAFDSWRRYDADRQGMIRDALTRIGDRPNVSRDMAEMVTRMLGA
ncbi:aminopeptidase N [Actibacterium pelagium]|uniref:Aminopeptidase N n=1 Tax=Actibacterium pelagium TaxID=2029103 RepID=A0A917AEM3_9RHOB|nr:aminopeptidase N [Actibacterium pelagium]GGE47109.1 aminopeptidase N [Actibacterium pelagium]